MCARARAWGGGCVCECVCALACIRACLCARARECNVCVCVYVRACAGARARARVCVCVCVCVCVYSASEYVRNLSVLQNGLHKSCTCVVHLLSEQAVGCSSVASLKTSSPPSDAPTSLPRNRSGEKNRSNPTSHKRFPRTPKQPATVLRTLFAFLALIPEIQDVSSLPVTVARFEKPVTYYVLEID